MEVKFEALERNIWKKLMKTPAIFCIIYAEKTTCLHMRTSCIINTGGKKT